MMRNLRKIRLSVLSAVLGAIFIMSEKSSEAAVVVLETSKGQVEIEMKPELAPNHVARITELVKQGFYDGIIFHRVIPGFMAQTGDPTGTGTGGSGENLNAEFTDYEYVEGTVGMARAMNPNSADSQFFICFEGCGHLTGQYTVWGQVTDGMDVVRKINEGQPPAEPDHRRGRARLVHRPGRRGAAAALAVDAQRVGRVCALLRDQRPRPLPPPVPVARELQGRRPLRRRRPHRGRRHGARDAAAAPRQGGPGAAAAQRDGRLGAGVHLPAAEVRVCVERGAGRGGGDG